jgi:hypothetical protein
MTPDGIPTPEWDRVHELAVEVANASMRDDAVLSEAKAEEMLSCLRELRVRHGDLPSILGTMADYVDDEVQQYDLYARAVAEARRIGDDMNVVMLLESILELECLDGEQRAFWDRQLGALKVEPGVHRIAAPIRRLPIRKLRRGRHPRQQGECP